MGTYHVIHIGDTHGRVDARSGDQWRALDAIIAVGDGYARAGTLALWLWPGDLFHSISEPDSRNALIERVQRLAALAPLVIVRGNHDLPGELDLFAQLRTVWPVHVVAHAPTLLDIETPLPDRAAVDPAARLRAAVFALPYPNAGALVSAGTPPDQIAQTARAALDGIVLMAADQLAAAPRGTLRIFAAHANTVGAISSVGQPQIGKDIELDATMFDRLPTDCYVALNHIHKHQTVGRGVYAGSICRMDFGELEPKGIVVAEWLLTRAGQANALELVGWEFQTIDVPAMYHVEGQLTPGGFAYEVVCGTDRDGDPVAYTSDTAAPPVSRFRGADVRVRYTYNRGDASALNVALIHAEFAEARTLKIEAVPADEHEIRAPDVVAALTVFDKLKAYAERQGIPWTASLADKIAALETRDCDNWRNEALSRIAAIGAAIGQGTRA